MTALTSMLAMMPPTSVTVVTSVGDDAASGLPFEKDGILQEIARLTGCATEVQRPAKRVREKMDLGGQSASGTPQSLILGPLLFRSRPAAGRARDWYRESRYSLRRSFVSTVKMRSQTPVVAQLLAQRVKHRCTLFHLPYRSRRSLQRAPKRSTHNTALTNKRLSLAARPQSPSLPGRNASIRAHCAPSVHTAWPSSSPNQIDPGNMEPSDQPRGNPKCQLDLVTPNA